MPNPDIIRTQRQRIIDLSLQFSQCPADDDDPNIVFNALALSLTALIMSFLAAEGKEVTAESVQDAMTRFMALAVNEGTRLLQDPDVTRIVAEVQAEA